MFTTNKLEIPLTVEEKEEIEEFGKDFLLFRARIKHLKSENELKYWQQSVDNPNTMPIKETAKNWMYLAYWFLHAVIEFQDKDGIEAVSTKTWEDNPQFAWIGNTLIHDGFVRKIDSSTEDIYPYRITTKGLSLYSALSNIDNYYAENVIKSDRQAALETYGFKILAALSGTQINNK